MTQQAHEVGRPLTPREAEVAKLIAGGKSFRRLAGEAGKSLTPRELEVAKLLADGKNVRETAKLLGMAHKTADVHKTRLMKKLDIHNRSDLTRWAIKSGLSKL